MEWRTAAQQSPSFNLLPRMLATYYSYVGTSSYLLGKGGGMGGNPIDHGTQPLMFMFPTRYYALGQSISYVEGL